MPTLLTSAAVKRWPCCKYEQMQHRQQPRKQTATRSLRLMTLTKRSESTIFVRVGMPPANDRFGDERCETELGSLQMQTYAASAKGRNQMTASSALLSFKSGAVNDCLSELRGFNGCVTPYPSQPEIPSPSFSWSSSRPRSSTARSRRSRSLSSRFSSCISP